ncbi:unnamed protein product [Dibothriocephalus latus]|uniref:E3 ubiquitin-protein ligase UBR-like C-terminal domain-containing protein n=1 Tax=Dibothriocephalus latus TaxID=60516 RepID=A0A3P7RCV0_DIBLA|nr:unnamed protein product [Dibothriocephalus latus]
MDIGTQLYPPRLIRPPRSFDDLFNQLHLVSCASPSHRFQENILCLVCGRLLCALCAHVSSVLVEVPELIFPSLLAFLQDVHLFPFTKAGSLLPLWQIGLC